MNILVPRTSNSARSILPDRILNTRGKGRLTSFSAGSPLAWQAFTGASEILGQRANPTSTRRSKSRDKFATKDAPEMQAVMTVCGSAANETGPMWSGAPLRCHCCIEDPAAASVSDQPAAFETACDIPRRRADAFWVAPVETLSDAGFRNCLADAGTLT